MEAVFMDQWSGDVPLMVSGQPSVCWAADRLVFERVAKGDSVWNDGLGDPCFDLIDTPAGVWLVAGQDQRVVHATLSANQEEALQLLKIRFPGLAIGYKHGRFVDLLSFFSGQHPVVPYRLALTGTPFQLDVWSQLMTIPLGGRQTYGQIAEAIGKPGAMRAVGTAIGRNPIAILVPCHRVLPSSGAIGGYMWGPERKQALLQWEAEAGK